MREVQAALANDADGNAVLTLGDGMSITFVGVDKGDLGASNFLFDQQPVTINSGSMVLSNGSIMPFSGIIENAGTIALEATSNITELQIIQHGLTLAGRRLAFAIGQPRQSDLRHGHGRDVHQRRQLDLWRRSARRRPTYAGEPRHNHCLRFQRARHRHRGKHDCEFRRAGIDRAPAAWSCMAIYSIPDCCGPTAAMSPSREMSQAADRL